MVPPAVLLDQTLLAPGLSMQTWAPRFWTGDAWELTVALRVGGGDSAPRVWDLLPFAGTARRVPEDRALIGVWAKWK